MGSAEDYPTGLATLKCWIALIKFHIDIQRNNQRTKYLVTQQRKSVSSGPKGIVCGKITLESALS